jgi:hypothetical protein
VKQVIFDEVVRVIEVRLPTGVFQIDAGALDPEEAEYWLSFARRKGWPDEVQVELGEVFKRLMERR